MLNGFLALPPYPVLEFLFELVQRGRTVMDGVLPSDLWRGKNPGQTLEITVSMSGGVSIPGPVTHYTSPCHFLEAFELIEWDGTPCLFVLITLNHNPRIR